MIHDEEPEECDMPIQLWRTEAYDTQTHVVDKRTKRRCSVCFHVPAWLMQCKVVVRFMTSLPTFSPLITESGIASQRALCMSLASIGYRSELNPLHNFNQYCLSHTHL